MDIAETDLAFYLEVRQEPLRDTANAQNVEYNREADRRCANNCFWK